MVTTFLDRNLTAADKELIELKTAWSKVGGTGNRMGNTIEAKLVTVDWNESEIGTTLLYVDQMPTTAAGAGAVANTDKAVEALAKVLRAIASGWHGAAADQADARVRVVKDNLENFKAELEQWAKDIGASTVEQATSATQRMSEITGAINRKAGEIADAHGHAVAAVNREGAGWGDPGFDAAAQEVTDAVHRFTTFVDDKIEDIGRHVFELLDRHNGPLTKLVNPNHAVPIMVHSGEFDWSQQALIAAKMEAMTALADLRDARNNLDRAYGSSLMFGTNIGAANTNAAWTQAARHRLNELEHNDSRYHRICLIQQVDDLIVMFERARQQYQQAEDKSVEQVDKILRDMFHRGEVAGSDSLAVKKADATARTDIDYVLNGTWRGIPDAMPPEDILPIEILPPEDEPPSWREPGEPPPEVPPAGRR